WAPVTGFHINPGGGLFLPGIRQQILSERAYLRTGAHNVRYVKSRLYIYTVLYQTLTSHFVSLALGLML
ncbi:hypothetical protein, partial [Klebsiella pneumoniae]|uniref:hypothetical protein n=1 Tax=Klebsiella pneumoniae TaxID=573 RepID=UPI003F6090B2